MISMDGILHSPMYMLVSESSEKFPANKHQDPPNIISFSSKTANMNKDDLKKFYLTGV